MKKIANKLDWNRMLGFEQITDVRDSDANELGPKVESKTGQKVGGKVGNKLGSKLGNKLGSKQGIKA